MEYLYVLEQTLIQIYDKFNMSDLEYETTDVVICGCGPTGAMLSGYLGQLGVPNIVLEKDTDITTDPRGIALDEDGIRLLQGLGLYSSIYTEVGNCKSDVGSPNSAL